MEFSVRGDVRRKLMQSIEDMSIRGLKMSAKWSSEQLLGMQDEVGDDADIDQIEFNSVLIPSSEKNLIHYANLLIVNGEYQRCAHVLRGKRLSNQINSNIGTFLTYYSLYMAGEKMKELSISEGSQNKTSTKDSNKGNRDVHFNPFLNDIFKDLLPAYQNKEMDAHLLYLFGIVVREVNRQGIPLPVEEMNDIPPYYVILFESVKLYPWNWSCWLELSYAYTNPSSSNATMPSFPAWLSHASSELVQVVGISRNGTPNGLLTDRNVISIDTLIMSALFLSHVLVEQQQGALSLKLLEWLQTIFPQSTNIICQIALTHYALRAYESAQDCFEHSREIDPYRLENLDVLSNILYVKENKAALSHLAHLCSKVDKYRSETCCVIGNYYSLRGQHEKAITSFQRALRVNRCCLSAWTLMGHEYVELKNTSCAVQCYRQAVEVSSSDYRAWYGLGQTYEMLHLHQYALYYYRRAAGLRPADARMWTAVGNCLSRLGSSSSREGSERCKREAIEAFERAIECDDREGLASRELARLYREMGRPAEAAKCYKKNIAGKILSEGESFVVDPDTAEAYLFLATQWMDDPSRLGDVEYCCSRLLDYQGPEASEARSILRQLRSTMSSA